MSLASILLPVVAFVRAIFALPLYLFDWLCWLVAFALKPYGPHGPSSRLGERYQGDPIFTLPGGHEPWLSEAKGELDLVQRDLVILRPKQPYV